MGEDGSGEMESGRWEGGWMDDDTLFDFYFHLQAMMRHDVTLHEIGNTDVVLHGKRIEKFHSLAALLSAVTPAQLCEMCIPYI